MDIIYEDESILVVNKPAGLSTQAPSRFDSLESRIRTYLQSQVEPDRFAYLGIPHRLDRCASGLLVFAKRIRSAQRLSKQFERREVAKIYLAWVQGTLVASEGVWRDSMRKVPDEPRAEIVEATAPGAKLACLRFVVVKRSAHATQVRIELETGRMHQIRLQAGSRGNPICGDTLYGSTCAVFAGVDDAAARQIALHAAELRFCHPKTRQEVAFSAPPPAIWQVLDRS